MTRYKLTTGLEIEMRLITIINHHHRHLDQEFDGYELAI